MRKELGIATYHAVQLFDTVHLVAYGENSSSGYRNYFEQSPLKIYPPIHNFFSDRPSGITLPVLTPFVAKFSFYASEELERVIVHGKEGNHEVKVEQISPAKLDLHQVIESSAPGVCHVHGTQDDVRNLFKSSKSAQSDMAKFSNRSAAYFERSLGSWVDPLTPPRVTVECANWCSLPLIGEFCCGHTYRTEAMRVEAVLTVQLAQPSNIQEQIEIALRDASVAGAFAALATALASGGTGAGQAFVATFTAVFQARLTELITEQILKVDVVFRTGWGPL